MTSFWALKILLTSEITFGFIAKDLNALQTAWWLGSGFKGGIITVLNYCCCSQCSRGKVFILRQQWIYFSGAFDLLWSILHQPFSTRLSPFKNPLPHSLSGNLCVIVYVKCYLLLPLNEVVSASVSLFSIYLLPQLWKHQDFHPLPQGDWIRLYLSAGKSRRWASGKTKFIQKFPVGK